MRESRESVAHGKIGLLRAAVRTDAVLLPWKRIVNRMVDDLRSGAILHMTEGLAFAAEWKSHVPAARISHLFAYEQV